MTPQLRLDLPDVPAGMLPALTVWQPWASAIFQAGKDVENRTWATAYRGPLVIHAGRTFDTGSHVDALLGAVDEADFPTGVVLGSVEVVDCTQTSDSVWAVAGHWHWLLADPQPLVVPVPARGRRGLWPVSRQVLEGRTA